MSTSFHVVFVKFSVHTEMPKQQENSYISCSSSSIILSDKPVHHSQDLVRVGQSGCSAALQTFILSPHA